MDSNVLKQESNNAVLVKREDVSAVHIEDGHDGGVKQEDFICIKEEKLFDDYETNFLFQEENVGSFI